MTKSFIKFVFKLSASASYAILPITKTEVKYNQNRDVKMNPLITKTEMLKLTLCTTLLY